MAKQNVTFPSTEGEAHGYLALPPAGSGQGLIVIQEWWGLTDHMAQMTDRLAAAGFVALAPDLYGGRTTHDADEAGQMMSALPPDEGARLLSGAVDFLLADSRVTSETLGAIGFCMGGAFVLRLAAREGGRISAAVPFYGVGQEPDYAGMTADVQAHYAAQDAFLPIEQARKVMADIATATGKAPELHEYPAGHAFMNDENLLGTYDAEQAAVAFDRAVGFLSTHIR